MAKKNMYYTQEILFLTELFGKVYCWMKDTDGHIYLTKTKETKEGLVPDLT